MPESNARWNHEPSHPTRSAVGCPLWWRGLLEACQSGVPPSPATASVVPPEPTEPEPPAAEPESEPPPEVVDAETVVEPVDPEPPSEPARRAPRRPPLSEPEPKEPDEPPPSTQLSGADEASPELVSKLQRAGSLLSSVGDRELSISQKEQLVAARSFVSQARQALADGDERRALVLIDKGLILAEDVERTSR